MNLNISTRFTNNFQGNNNIKDIPSNENEFNDFLEEVENINKEINLDIEEEDFEDSINYEFIQTILNTIKIIDLRDTIDINKNGLLDLENVDSDASSQLDLLKIIESVVKDNRFDSTNINDAVKLDNNKISELIKQNIENGNIDKEEFIKFKNALGIKSDSGTDIVLDKNYILNNKDSNVKDELKQEVNNIEGYKQLEISSLSNKNNLLEKNLLNSNSQDKDIDVLESILDTKDKKDFTIQNNNLNVVNSELSRGGVSSEAPISTIREEFIGEDIVKTVKYLKANGVEEIKIKISPRELGDMSIKLIKNAEETKVLITISKENIFDMVNKNIGDITKHLNELNINVKEVSIDIKNDNQKLFSGDLSQEFDKKNQGNKKKRNKYEDKKIENIEEIKVNDRVEENINILA